MRRKQGTGYPMDAGGVGGTISMKSRARSSTHALGVALIVCLCAGALLATRNAADDEPAVDLSRQETPAQLDVKRQEIHVSPIQIDVNLVVVNVTVTDPFDRIVTGLDRSNFHVYDEKVEQRIVAFSNEDAPIAVGLIFDSSGSMGGKIQKAKEAALQFFKTSNPQDEFLLINFNERVNLISGFTSKYENVQSRLLFVKSSGKTALFDAIYLGLSEGKKANTNRKALLVISDGGDNHSRYTERDVKKAVKESDCQIYSVGVFEPLSARIRRHRPSRTRLEGLYPRTY
jgi:VWFA-related protein